jgi:hypothetical protein
MTREQWERWRADTLDPYDMEAPAQAATYLCHAGPDLGPWFTWEDVEQLQAMPDGTGYASINDEEWYQSLIDRIAALLPPRP